MRNAQATVLAPTGTISFLMDCDTTGIEPDLGLVKTKKLVGGGTMSIVNQTVPRALKRLGYSTAEVDEIVAYIDEHKTIVGAPNLQADHLPVFACSMGDNTIHYLGHVKMMAAAQPFISGAISKTVNIPEQVTVEEVEQMHIDAWRMGLKAIAIYRDNCKVAQPLATTKRSGAEVPLVTEGEDLVLAATAEAVAHAREGALLERIAELEGALQERHVIAPATTTRTRLPRRRRSNTFAFRVADCEGYVTVGEYEDGRPGEVFMKVSKQGSTLSGVMDAFSIAVSLGLQHGVPAVDVRPQVHQHAFRAGGDHRRPGVAVGLEPCRLHLQAIGPRLPELRRAARARGALDGGADPAHAARSRGRRQRAGSADRPGALRRRGGRRSGSSAG